MADTDVLLEEHSSGRHEGQKYLALVFAESGDEGAYTDVGGRATQEQLPRMLEGNNRFFPLTCSRHPENMTRRQNKALKEYYYDTKQCSKGVASL